MPDARTGRRNDHATGRERRGAKGGTRTVGRVAAGPRGLDRRRFWATLFRWRKRPAMGARAVEPESLPAAAGKSGALPRLARGRLARRMFTRQSPDPPCTPEYFSQAEGQGALVHHLVQYSHRRRPTPPEARASRRGCILGKQSSSAPCEGFAKLRRRAAGGGGGAARSPFTAARAMWVNAPSSPRPGRQQGTDRGVLRPEFANDPEIWEKYRQQSLAGFTLVALNRAFFRLSSEFVDDSRMRKNAR